jgi:hypothetical protein
MKKRIAYNINIKNTPVEKARAYAEKEFTDAGMDLDKLLPDFDKNYKLLQKRLRGALEIPRIDMPVIEPTDMALFNKRLNEGAVDIFKPYAKGQLFTPKNMSKDEGEEWVHLGFEDGAKSDDVVKGKLGGIAVAKLKPTQSQIWFDKIVQIFIKFGTPGSGSIVLKQTVIVSGDYYLLDGHHRYAQAMLADPQLKIKALYIPLPIQLLLAVGKSYGEAIGNKPKASVSDRIARSITARVSARDILKGYLVAALWAETDDDGDPFDYNYDIRDIAGSSLRKAKRDVNNFLKAAGDLLTLDLKKGDEIGHDLWLNRNGHGAGFWDGDYPQAGKELDKIASKMGSKYVYVGDDGKVYID